MGVPAELSAPPRRGRPGARARRGIALPTALFGLVVLSVLGAGIYSIGSVQRQAAFNREGTERALLVTEEGIAHAVAVVRDSLRSIGYTRLLKGSDNTGNTADDGRVNGYTLGSTLAIPNAGKSTTDGSYTVRIMDDPGDPVSDPLVDGNYKVVLRCTGTTTSGASATVDVLIGSTIMPAMTVDGPLTISGNPDLLGAGGGAHSNGTLNLGGGTVTSSGPISSSGSVMGSGNVVDTTGALVSPRANQPTVEVPTFTTSEFCANADYDLRSDGTIYTRATGSVVTAITSAVNGWQRKTSPSPARWYGGGPATVGGTYCVSGNVEISGNTGSPGSPIALTLIAVGGSVSISGGPYLKPALEDVLVIADGDVALSGTSSSGYDNYEGTVYAGAQCYLSGTAAFDSQIICKNGSQPAGAIDYATTTTISGSPTITYACGSTLARRKILQWIQVSN